MILRLVRNGNIEDSTLEVWIVLLELPAGDGFNGYDYEPAGNAMQIYLRTTDLTKAVPEVVSFL